MFVTKNNKSHDDINRNAGGTDKVTTIQDFFALRPTFTVGALRLVWWAFLLERALSLIGIGSAIFQTSSLTLSTLLLYLPNLLDIVVWIALVRIFLEVAVLVIRRHEVNPN